MEIRLNGKLSMGMSRFVWSWGEKDVIIKSVDASPLRVP
jgi:hypothetical protein